MELQFFSRLLVDKLQKIGIPPGPLYGRIKKGEAITTPSGDIVSVIGIITALYLQLIRLYLGPT